MALPEESVVRISLALVSRFMWHNITAPIRVVSACIDAASAPLVNRNVFELLLRRPARGEFRAALCGIRPI